MIILIDAKNSKKFNTKSLFKKKIRKLGIKGIFVNFIYSIYKNPIANIILNGKTLNSFPLRYGTKEGCPLSQLLFNTVLEVLASKIRHKRK